MLFFSRFFADKAARDALEIQQATDYRIIRAGWDEYISIQTHQHHNYSQAYGVATPAWYALQAIQDHQGRFRNFPKDEIKFLYALLEAHEAYGEIIQVLKQHGREPHEIEGLFATHPHLYNLVPQENHLSEDSVIDYIIEHIEIYQQKLDRYVATYGTRIRRAIQLLENSGS